MRLTKHCTFISFSALLLLFLVAGSSLRADTIYYQTTDLGSGNWQYTYTLSGFNLTANELIAIYFDINSDSNLDPSPVPPNSDWSLQVFQPDPGIPTDGEMDSIAQVDSPSLADPFTESFTYSGSGTPGPQSFSVYDTNFNDIFDGQTQVVTPEPSTMLLVGSAIGLALLSRRRIRKKRALPFLCLVALASLTAHAEIRVTGRTLISSTRVSPTNYNYVYSLQVENLGTAVTNVSAVATSFVSTTGIVQGNVTFPDIPAGGTATSTTNLTISQNRTVAIDWTLIRFAFSAISAPVANAGPDQLISTLNNNGSDNGNPGLPYCCYVNGRDSYDPFGLPLTYSWTIVSEPSESTAGFWPYTGSSLNLVPSMNTVAANFVPDLPGDYVLQLIVNNGYLNSAPSYVRLSTNPVAPRADAGWNKTIQAGQNVQLDGTHSVNPMNRPLTYAWSFVASPAGSNPVLSDPTNPRPTFLASLAGTYTLQLQVTDGTLTSAPATVTFTTGNTPPRADAGPDMHIYQDSYGFLSANRSTDVNGDFLTYRWAILSGSFGQPTLDSVPNPDFFVPGANDIHVQLFVNDGYSESISTLLVSGQRINYGIPPAPLKSVLPAIAMVDAHGPAPSTYTLDATPSVSSDLSIAPWPQPQLANWALRESPSSSSAGLTPSGGSNLTATITPDQSGLYIAQVQSQDWGYWSYPTAVSFQTHGDLPVANPGSTQFGLWTAPALHTLSGSASYDPDGAALTYRWSLQSKPVGSTASLSSTTAVSPTFTADMDGTYIFQLIVNNGQSDSLPATVSIIPKDTAAPLSFNVSIRSPWRSPCVPVTVLGDDVETNATGLYGKLTSLPTEGFLTGNIGSDGYMLIFGNVGTPGMNPSGLLAANTMCYLPFSSSFVGFDIFTYEIFDEGYPAGFGTAGNYCIAPKMSSTATVAIEIYQP